MCCVLALGLVVLQLVPAGATSRQRRREPQEALVEGAPVPKVAEFTEWQPFLGERAAPAKPSAPAETPVETTPAAAPAPHLVEGSAATPLPPALLVQQALPNCSVVFFHHLEKTAGTTLRSVLQREAQLGLFDFFSFVNRYNKVQQHGQSAPLGSAPARPLCLLRASLATLGSSVLPERGPATGRPATTPGARAGRLQVADFTASDHLGPVPNGDGAARLVDWRAGRAAGAAARRRDSHRRRRV